MAVYRVITNKNYTTMANFHLRDKNLSLKAKGLLSIMLSLPKDWDYSQAGLATLSKDGMDSVRSTLNELESKGYLVRQRNIKDNGHFSDIKYSVFEKSIFTMEDADFLDYAKQAENPDDKNEILRLLKIKKEAAGSKKAKAGASGSKRSKAEGRALGKPTTGEPILEKPTAESPVLENSTAGEPILENSTAGCPVLGKPTAENPILKNATAGNPILENATAGNPILENATAGNPVLENSTAGNPILVNSTLSNSTLGNPISGKPISEKPISENPTQIITYKTKRLNEINTNLSIPFRKEGEKKGKPKSRDRHLSEEDPQVRLLLSLYDYEDEDSAIQMAERTLRRRFDYDLMVKHHPGYKGMLDGMISLMISEAFVNPKKEIRIASGRHSTSVVRKRFLRLNSSHLLKIIENLEHVEKDPKNDRQYVLACLYNAPDTVDLQITAETAVRVNEWRERKYEEQE